MHKRKRIRLEHTCYELSGQVFSITICTATKQPIFKNPPYADMLIKAIHEGCLMKEADCFAFCLMPNHLHLLIAPLKINLMELLGRWKAYTTNLLHKAGVRGTIWQRSFYDHALKKEENIAEVVNYIIYNPVRFGIVDDWQEYPYSWHKWL